MNFNEVVNIIEEVKENLTAEQKKRYTHYENDYKNDFDNGERYYYDVGGILGGNNEEERQELFFFIKPFDYPTPTVAENEDLDEWYNNVVNNNEYADKHYDENDIDKINHGEYKFDSWEIVSERFDYSSGDYESETYDNAESILNDIDCFIENIETYYGDLETV